MKEILQSLLLSFNMYSILPLPYAKWREENMRYVLSFFPLVGLPEAFLYILIWRLAHFWDLGIFLRAALLSVLSLVYTGGIHLDGYLDTCDALGSNQSREKKLEILKDSHIGAYALMGGLLYFVLYFGAMTEIQTEAQLHLYAVCAVLLRGCSALSLFCLPNARGSGFAQSFRKPAKDRASVAILLAFILASSLLLLYMDRKAWILLLAAFLCFIGHLYMAKKVFGGLTGDLCGYFLQTANLLLLLVLVLMGRIF